MELSTVADKVNEIHDDLEVLHLTSKESLAEELLELSHELSLKAAELTGQ